MYTVNYIHNINLSNPDDQKMPMMYIYIYIYIYKILFNPLNPELGTIPSRTIRIFKNRINVNNPGKELNVNKKNNN